MRPWLLLPIVFVGLWGGITYAGMWPDDVVDWLASPVFAVVLTFAGIALAMLADNLVRERRVYRRPRPRWFRHRQATEEPEILEERPLVQSETPFARAWRATTDLLRVDMPERQTATPAPRK